MSIVDKNIVISENPSSHKVKSFDELPVSTITVMVYSNIHFETERIFKSIPIFHINPPLTKKEETYR